jgi:hypothetical protein
LIILSNSPRFNYIIILSYTWSSFWDYYFCSNSYNKQVFDEAALIAVRCHAPFHILLPLMDLF